MWKDIMRQLDNDRCQNITWNEFKTVVLKVFKVKAGDIHKHRDK